ncbi:MULTISPECIES: hypothetical protein [Hydrocarboniphaga]|uniref:hypothetical protein n=1 Tax=Hydrocarboniphaga TaxID=243627 RepID=UPI0012F97369|nr:MULTISPECIES: hypothetical protein [Hydrocarboniphaga]MDZ4079879.1 hypothetical protein [Hydrocarboniphaga sp.]
MSRCTPDPTVMPVSAFSPAQLAAGRGRSRAVMLPSLGESAFKWRAVAAVTERGS